MARARYKRNGGRRARRLRRYAAVASRVSMGHLGRHTRGAVADRYKPLNRLDRLWWAARSVRHSRVKRSTNPTFGPRRRIKFVDYRGQVRSATTVMRDRTGTGWVVNLGGRYGTPAVVPDSAIVSGAPKVRRRRNPLSIAQAKKYSRLLRPKVKGGMLDGPHRKVGPFLLPIPPSAAQDRALRTLRLKNPILQAVFPAITQGAATGLGFALGGKLFSSASVNPRRANGRHGVERAPAGLKRPAQRLVAPRIIDHERAACMRIPSCRRSYEAHRRFHGHEPVHLTQVTLADGKPGTTVRYGFVVGESPEVTYQTWKHARSNKRSKDGKRVTWVHKYGEGGGRRPLLIHEPDSGLTSYLGGSYRVTDWFHK